MRKDAREKEREECYASTLVCVCVCVSEKERERAKKIRGKFLEPNIKDVFQPFFASSMLSSLALKKHLATSHQFKT